MKKKWPTSLNFIDVFSGAGGMSCGMELAGHTCLLGVDHEPAAIKTFDYNHKKANVYCGDIKNLDEATLKELIGHKEIHAVVGGPPCQGFSTVGTNNPKDKRNSLFRHFVRIVKIVNPYFVVIENVTGLLSKNNEKTLLAILKEFSNLGYSLDARVLKSEQYGVPEKRRRTIIIGTRINQVPIYPKLTNELNPVTIGEAFKDLKTYDGKIHNHDVDAAKITKKLDLDRIKKIPEGLGIRYQEDEEKYLPKSLRFNINWSELKENRFRQTKYQRLSRNAPSPTIMTHRHSYYHPTENRFLTQREAAKCQSFPNDFIFLGAITKQWRQIGNAVPPLMAKAIGLALTEMVKKAKKTSSSTNLPSKKSQLTEIIKKQRKTAFVYGT